MILNSVIRKLLSMWWTPWAWESGFSSINFINSKYKSSISDELLPSELTGTLEYKTHTGFQRLNVEKGI